MRVFKSKDDLYKVYPIALKFVREEPKDGGFHHHRDYKDVYPSLATTCRAKLDKFSDSVKNFRTQYPLSVGFYVEIPVRVMLANPWVSVNLSFWFMKTDGSGTRSLPA